VLDETTPLPEALATIEQAIKLIHELEALLPPSSHSNFRERLVEHLETLEKQPSWNDADLAIRLKADALIVFYKQVFGVDDLIVKPGEWPSLI
jgi:hypothetical protein